MVLPILIAAILVTAASVAPQAVHAATSTMSSVPPNALISQEAPAVQSWAKAQGSTGIFWDSGSRAFVARVPNSQMAAARTSLARTSAWQAAGMTLPVRTLPATASAKDVNAGLALLARQDWAPGVKKYSWSFYYDVQRDVTVVQTNAPAALTEPLLRLIKAPIDLQHSAFNQDATRNNDVSPFYGGAGIVDTSTNEQCTAGFAVSNELGDIMLLTAGHCGNVGDKFRVLGTATQSGTTPVGIGFIKGPYPTYDSMAILCQVNTCANTYAGRLWISGTQSEPVKGESRPAVGESDWFTSGSVTNYHGGRTIDSLTATICTGGQCTGSLVSFHGTTVCGPGDSGSPLFEELNGSQKGAWVGGTYVGANGSEMYAENWFTLKGLYSGGPEVVTG